MAEKRQSPSLVESLIRQPSSGDRSSVMHWATEEGECMSIR